LFYKTTKEINIKAKCKLKISMLSTVQGSFFHLLPSNFALLFDLSREGLNGMVNSFVVVGLLFYVVGDYLKSGADERTNALNTRLAEQEEVLEAFLLYVERRYEQVKFMRDLVSQKRLGRPYKQMADQFEEQGGKEVASLYLEFLTEMSILERGEGSESAWTEAIKLYYERRGGLEAEL
jgi:hypothetical protein